VTTFGGTAEKFESARVTNDSAAHVVVCSYELAEQASLLIENLEGRGCLAGIFFNEAHQLDPSLVDFRDFDPVQNMFKNITAQGVKTTTIFMTATLRHPQNILNFCGLSKDDVTYYCITPIRDNLKFSVHLLKGTTKNESHKNIMNAVVEAIKTHANTKRTVIFVMYIFEIEAVIESLRESFPDRELLAYDKDRKPDVTNLGPTAIVVATSALKTGTNMSETNLALLYGGAYSLEDWIQAAGRTGRCPGSEGLAITLFTPYAIDAALRIASAEKKGTGTAKLKEVIEILKVHPGIPVQESLRDAFPTTFDSLEQSQQTQDQKIPTHVTVQIVHRALQVVSLALRSHFIYYTLTGQGNSCRLRIGRRPMLCVRIVRPLQFRMYCARAGACRCEKKKAILNCFVQESMKNIYIQFKCCCECGLPIKKVYGQLLHTSGFGRLCTMPKFFRLRLCQAADEVGQQPHEHLRHVFGQGKYIQHCQCCLFRSNC
jgi:superfamily II DNA helicase RecQ